MALTRQTERRVLILQPTDAEVSTNQVYAARYEWRVDGELTFPVATVIDSLKHTEAAFSIYKVDVSVNQGGTSQYQLLIKSYDANGLNPIVHVDQYVNISVDKRRVAITVLDAAVPENRSLELTLYENSVGIPASDMTVTLTAEDFAAVSPERQGHRVLDSTATVMAQRADLQFRDMEAYDDGPDNRTVVRYPDGLAVSANDIDWTRGYVFHKSISATSSFTFSNIVEGRIITLIIHNTSASGVAVSFPAGIYRDPSILLTIEAGKANVYTFVRANSKTYCSFIAGLTNV